MSENLSKEDFKSGQEVKWCPGCGDYAILSTIQKTLPSLNIPKEDIVFISGIGCAGRLPYYLNTYGFHTIHGRAPAFAAGLKMTRPELSVWIITGDGDALSIGSNHLLHTLRRNIDVKILLINNKIYGLTKGQYSPTSERLTITPTSPQGSIESPVNPIAFALAAGASFVARAIDTDADGLQSILTAAALHKGSAFIEIYQNCYVFNNNAFDHIRNKSLRTENGICLEDGKPLLFGKDLDKGLILEDLTLKVVNVFENNNKNKILIHNSKNEALAYLLSRLVPPHYPIPTGIFKNTEYSNSENQLTTNKDDSLMNTWNDYVMRKTT